MSGLPFGTPAVFVGEAMVVTGATVKVEAGVVPS